MQSVNSVDTPDLSAKTYATPYNDNTFMKNIFKVIYV